MVLLVRAVTVNNENSSAPDPLAGSMKELNRRPSMLSRHANPVPKYDVDYDERRGDAVWTCINMDIPPPSKLWVPKEEYRTKAIGVIDGDENIDKEHPAIINLIHQVRQAAASRCSCTIINIGTPHSNSEDFFSNIVDLLMRTIGPTAERALQTVADELANEKQMQRLMLNETEEEAESSVLIASEKLAADEIKAFVRPPSPSIKDMSPHLQRALRTASSARKMMTTRFGIYTSTSNEIILPPKHNNSLKAKGLEGFKSPRSKIRDSSIVYGGAIRGDGPRDSLPSPKRRLSLRRLSSLRLMQQLADQEPDSCGAY